MKKLKKIRARISASTSMGRKHSKTNKAKIGHRFKNHISADWYEERVFANHYPRFGIINHELPRYVYSRTSKIKLKKFHADLVSKGLSSVPFDVYVADFYKKIGDDFVAGLTKQCQS